MFWGLILESGKRYSQKVVKSFHVSMATLEIHPHTDNENVPVMLEHEDGREYLLCNLNKNRSMQCSLDLNFKSGETIGFYSASGKSRVHLTGYLVEELEDLDSSADEDEEEVDEEEEETGTSNSKKRKEETDVQGGGKKQKLNETNEESEEEDDDEEEEDEDDDDDDDAEEEEEDDSDDLISPVKKKEKILQPNLNQSTSKEKKMKKVQSQPQDKTSREQNGQVNTPESKPSKKNKKGETTTPSSSKELQGGVSIDDKVVGNGQVARPGNKVTVYYVGRLKGNNKQFDACTSGPGFKFNLGRGDVIKGWDIGVSGMRVGGKRTISVPPAMGYGKRGQPPVIPPQSTLIFDVELRNVV